jgi:hypothetical protein
MVSIYLFFHLARAPILAIAALCFALIFSALALPPFNPPFLPSATAAGFFPSYVIGNSISPVAISVMNFASWFVSRGRLLERLGMPLEWHSAII